MKKKHVGPKKIRGGGTTGGVGRGGFGGWGSGEG